MTVLPRTLFLTQPAAALLAGLLLSVHPAVSIAQDTATRDVVFVQSAPGVTYDPATRVLTLQDVNLVTVFFSPGTPPIAGKMLTTEFVELWNAKIAANLVEPPVADVSEIDAGDIHQTVLGLSTPSLQDSALTYQVLPGESEIRLMGGDASLFISIAGVPEALFSFPEGSAGLFRRAELK